MLVVLLTFPHRRSRPQAPLAGAPLLPLLFSRPRFRSLCSCRAPHWAPHWAPQSCRQTHPAQCTPHTHNPAVWAAGRTLGSPSRPGRGPDSWFSMVTPCPTGSETLMKGGHAGVPGTDPSPGRGTVLQGGLQLSAEARHARRLLTLGDPYSREGHPGASEEPPLPSGMCRLESRGGNAPTSFHPISPERGSGMHFMRLLRGSPQGSWWPQLETLSSHCLSSLLWLRGHIPE